MKYCNQKSEFPAAPHIAVIHFTSIYIPGDERSRSHPGHGYPGGSESVVKYITFNDTPDGKEELRKWIEQNQKENFMIIEATPKVVKTKLTVDLS